MVSGAAINHQAVLEAIPGSKGIILNICRKTGHSWTAVKGAIKENPILQKAYQDECDSTVDHVETKMFDLIDEGDSGLTKWYLNCKGKDRGYAEKIELSGTVQLLDPQPIEKPKDAGVAGKND